MALGLEGARSEDLLVPLSPVTGIAQAQASEGEAPAFRPGCGFKVKAAITTCRGGGSPLTALHVQVRVGPHF